ncbi:cysteine desulfurase [Cytophagaceae bacterium ABcell3]|nr:cysteine desulfurase [Cytophagaceae bacterium ABcell3]
MSIGSEQPTQALSENSLDKILKARNDFPVLSQEINGKPLVYFDNAATTQKPKVVTDALVNYYSGYNANIHRGIHTLAEKATSEFESTRAVVKEFINAPSTEEVIFTKGTTESINLVASTFGRKYIGEGDEIIVSAIEHHSNMVPWQILAAEKGAKIKVIPINDEGELLMGEYKKLLNERTKLVAVVHVSNTLGTINPVKEIVSLAKEKGITTLIDGAQATSHLDIDVQDLDTDFYAFSAHKVYGPTGTGILYGKKAILEDIPPYQGGGEMIQEVSYEGCSFNVLPYKFEAGTPNIADVIAFKHALEYVNSLGKSNIRAYENQLLEYANEKLSEIKGLTFVGTAKEKVSVISFLLEGIHHQDTGIILDQEAIAIRTGHHCTQPLMQRLNISGTARASFALYNTKEEIDRLVKGILKVQKMLAS